MSKSQAAGKPLKDLYELDELPPLGHVPEKMYAWAIRRERHGPPQESFQVEVVPTWSIGEEEGLLLVMAGGVNYLVNYPYQCAEQKASAAFAFLLAADLGNAFSVGTVPPADYRDQRNPVQQPPVPVVRGARVPVHQREVQRPVAGLDGSSVHRRKGPQGDALLGNGRNHAHPPRQPACERRVAGRSVCLSDERDRAAGQLGV